MKMKKSYLLLAMATSVLFSSCSREEEIMESETTTTLTVSCGGPIFIDGDELDGTYMLGETILIPWDILLCGGSGGIPSKVSIIFTELGGLPQYGTIASDISPFFQSNASYASMGNISWVVEHSLLEENKTYVMILQSEDTGEQLSTHNFTINGVYTPPACGFSTSDELDGDYRIRFSINNNSTCYANMRYDVDYGDGATVTILRDTNTFSFAHQYPYTYGVYNVTITKSNATTNEVYATKTVSVAAKRD